MKTTLQIEERGGRSVSALRAQNMLPGVVYGPKQPNIGIAIEKATFEKLFKQAGEATVITLTGLDHEIDVLVHDVGHHSLQGGISHVDFYALEKGKEITTNVPLEFVGEAPVEKTGGIINKVLHEIEVTSLANDLPAKITVDLSVLTEIDQKIHVSDLEVGKKVTLNAQPDDVIVVAMPPAEEEPETGDEVVEGEGAAAVAEAKDSE